MRTVVVVALLVAGPAYADDPAPPRPVAVHGQLDGPTAKLVVRYEVRVDGPSVVRDAAELTVPSRGIVTGATVSVAGVSHRLRLDPVEAAETAFQGVAEADGAGPRGWAFRIELLGSSLLLSVAAPQAARVVLDLDVDVATCMFRDVRYAAMPASWRPVIDATLARRHATDGDVEAACPSELDASERVWIAFASRELASRPFGDQRIGVIASRLPLADSHLARVELDLAGELGEVPADLYTAIVVDSSRSMTRDELDAQRTIVASYLQHAPNSRVQIIAFARAAKPLLPGWSNAAQARPRVDGELRALAGRNGSNLDAGLALAGTWLAQVTGTKRIVVFTDELLAERLLDTSPVVLKRLVPDGTLVHVVALTGAEGTLERADDALLAPLAMATDGIAVHGQVDAHGAVDATLLVRPISLDEVKLLTPGWETITPSVSEACSLETGSTIAEGTSCTWWGEGGTSSGPIAIEGLIWGRRVTRLVRPDPVQARTLARMMSAAGGLADEIQREVDRIAEAVNAVWSLDGTWGGKGGYGDVGEIGGIGSTGGGGGSCCDTGTIGTGHGTHAALIRPNDLRDQLAAAAAPCHPGDAKVELVIETTLEEIVNVEASVYGIEKPGAARVLRECIVDAVWNTMVAIPDAPGHATTDVTL